MDDLDDLEDEEDDEEEEDDDNTSVYSLDFDGVDDSDDVHEDDMESVYADLLADDELENEANRSAAYNNANSLNQLCISLDWN